MKRWIAVVMVIVPQIAAAQDVEGGSNIAKRWCADCHTIERTPPRARADSVSSFVDIAARPGTSKLSLYASMTAEHGRMPNFSLTNAEMNDLSAYILSLRR